MIIARYNLFLGDWEFMTQEQEPPDNPLKNLNFTVLFSKRQLKINILNSVITNPAYLKKIKWKISWMKIEIIAHKSNNVI